MYVSYCVVFVCIVCVSVPLMRKSGCADHCEVKHSSINQSTLNTDELLNFYLDFS